jgi:methyl-accepting chemotaxis protein
MPTPHETTMVRSPQDAVHPQRATWAVAVALIALAGSVMLCWRGGWLALAGMAMTALACVWWARRWGVGSPGRPSRHASTADASASIMVSQVVPVWVRQMEASRQVAQDGLDALLNSFNAVAEAVERLNAPMKGMEANSGAMSELMAHCEPAIAAIKSCTVRGLEQRDHAVQCLRACDALGIDLERLAGQVNEVARHTRLVSFNASIEATRGAQGDANGGSASVAQEVRMMAQRIQGLAQEIQRVAQSIRAATTSVSRSASHLPVPEAEISLEIDILARAAIGQILSGLAQVASVSDALKTAGTEIQSNMETAFVNFQFGDRLSQMLDIVGKDMTQLTRWVEAHPHATHQDAARWLADLEATYTMEEQRSTHHGNAHVAAASNVEFF